MDAAKERLRRREQMEIDNENKTFSLKKFAFATSKLQGLIKSKDDQMKEDLKDFSNMVFDEVSQFITFFINYNLPFRLAKNLLQWTSEQYVTDKQMQRQLMTELRSSQRNPERMFTDEENRVWSLQKRSNRFTQFGYTDLTLVLGCSIKFIDADTTLMSICCASRDCYALLRPEVLK